ncbi:hypothetical protein ACIBI9_54405 [Nonomuraea sp. NPDC050451]|uniref:hypothetical protein n=1 Tax=Nonomuraea sp. NPDC050451 TaxID=3364364 RepID=UPI00378BC095
MAIDALSAKTSLSGGTHSDRTPSDAFGHYVMGTAFGAYSSVPVPRTDLDGAWASADKMMDALNRKFSHLEERSEAFHKSHEGFGQLVYVAAMNYDTAEGILDRRLDKLRKVVHGQQDPGRSRPPSDTEPWHEEDVSANSAAGIRKFFERSHPERLLDLGVVLHNFADRMADAASAIEGHSKGLAQVWGSEAAELCQQALRMLHGSAKTLAYDAGRTGDVLLSFGELYWRYKENCAKAVGDFEIDDLWEWAGGEDNEDDERARQYLREFNQQMGFWYDMIPADAELLLPQIAYVEYVDLYHDEEGTYFDRLEKDEPFSWLFNYPWKEKSPDPILPKESATEILETQLQEPYRHWWQ